MADTTINVAPLINEVVIPIVVALAGVLATWLSTKLAALLGVKKDDALFAIEAPGGYFLTPYDPEVEAQVKLGLEFMREYRDTFRALAK